VLTREDAPAHTAASLKEVFFRAAARRGCGAPGATERVSHKVRAIAPEILSSGVPLQSRKPGAFTFGTHVKAPLTRCRHHSSRSRPTPSPRRRTKP
jgi:hypothetical protein